MIDLKIPYPLVLDNKIWKTPYAYYKAMQYKDTYIEDVVNLCKTTDDIDFVLSKQINICDNGECYFCVVYDGVEYYPSPSFCEQDVLNKIHNQFKKQYPNYRKE